MKSEYEITITDGYLLIIEDMVIISHLPLIGSGGIKMEKVPLLPPLEDQSSLPKGFRCEIVLCEELCDHGRCKHRGCQNPINGDTIKTTVNKNGDLVWVGEYI